LQFSRGHRGETRIARSRANRSCSYGLHQRLNGKRLPNAAAQLAGYFQSSENASRLSKMITARLDLRIFTAQPALNRLARDREHVPSLFG
jgi:hypothetical protein